MLKGQSNSTSSALPDAASCSFTLETLEKKQDYESHMKLLLLLLLLLLVRLLLCRIYELYSDFVMKNPFYEVEQVRASWTILCTLWRVFVPLHTSKDKSNRTTPKPVLGDLNVAAMLHLYASCAAAAAAAAACTQVIKCELFDEALDLAVKRYPLMLLAAPQQVSD
jgi:hypothetical protein